MLSDFFLASRLSFGIGVQSLDRVHMGPQTWPDTTVCVGWPAQCYYGLRRDQPNPFLSPSRALKEIMMPLSYSNAHTTIIITKQRGSHDSQEKKCHCESLPKLFFSRILSCQKLSNLQDSKNANGFETHLKIYCIFAGMA